MANSSFETPRSDGDDFLESRYDIIARGRSYNPLAPRPDQWWLRNAIVASVDVIRAVEGSLRALFLSRLHYWCSIAKSSRRFRTHFVVDGEPRWGGTYASMARELGSSPQKVRTAMQTLRQGGYINVCATDRFWTVMTDRTWGLYGGRPEEQGPHRDYTPHGNPARGVTFLVTPEPRPCGKLLVPVPFVHICRGDVNAAFVLSDLAWWHRKNHEASRLRASPSGQPVFFKSRARLADETGLSSRQLERAVTVLEGLGFVHHIVRKVPTAFRRYCHFGILPAEIEQAMQALAYLDGFWQQDVDE